MLILNAIAGILTIWLSVQAWQKRHTARTQYLALLSGALAIFYIATVLEGVLPFEWGKVAAVKVEFVVLPLVPPLFFLTALSYTRHIRHNILVPISAIPFITIVLTLTNEMHHLMWTGYTIKQWGAGAFLHLDYGLWFWVHSGYSFALALGGSAILMSTLPQRLPQERKLLIPISFLAAAGAIVLAVYLLYLRQFMPNPIPFFVIGIAALYIYGLRLGPLYRIPPLAYPLIVEHMTEGLIVVNERGIIVGVNPATEHMLKRPRSELLNRPVREVLADFETLLFHLDTKTPVNLTIDLDVPPRGAAYEVKIVPTAAVIPPGGGYLITLHDITERQRLERQLFKRVAHLETLQVISEKQAPLLDVEAICQVATDTLYNISKFAHAAVYLVDEETNDRVLVAATGVNGESLPERIPPGRGLSERPLLDGRLHYTPDVTKAPQYVPGLGGGAEVDAPVGVGGKIYGVLIVESEEPHSFTPSELSLIEAVARQTALAIERALVHRQVKEAEAQYRNLFETMPVGLYRVTLEGRLVVFNPALAHILGVPLDKLSHLHAPDLYVDARDREQWIQMLLESEDGTYQVMEAHLRRPDGVDIWVRNTARLIRDEEGNPVYIEGYVEDITQAVKARQEQEALLARVEHQQKAIAELLVHPAIVEGKVDDAARVISELAVNTLNTHRACVYQMTPNEERMIALDVFDRAQGTHTHGFLIPPPSFPFSPSSPRVFIVEDAHKDPRTASIVAMYDDLPAPLTALVAPIHVGGRPVGLISVQYLGTKRAWTEDEKRFLAELADLMAQVMLNARLRQYAEQLTTLNETLLAISSQQDTAALLDKVLEQAASLTQAESAVLLLNDPEAQRLRVAAVYNYAMDVVGKTLDYSEGVAGYVIQTGEPLLVHDYLKWPHKSLVASMRYRSIFCVPVQWGDEILGILQVLHPNPGYFPPEIHDLFVLFARHVALALRNARLLEEERRRAEALEALHQAGLKVSATLDLNEVLAEVLRGAVTLVNAYDAHIFLYDGERLHFGSAYWEGKVQDKPFAQPREGGVTYTVARTGKPLIIPDVNAHPLYKNWQWGGALASLPLKVRDSVVGVMNVAFNHPHQFTDEERRLLALFADQAAIAIENARLLREVRQQAQELDILRQVLQILNASPQIEDVFGDLGAILKQATGAMRVSLAIANLEENTFTIQALDAPRDVLDVGTTMPITTTSAAEDVLAGRPHLTPDLSQELDRVGERVLYAAGVRSRVNIPVKVGDKVIGSLNFTWDQVHGYHDDQIPLLQQVADALALAIERSRILREIRRQATELETLYTFSLALASLRKVEDLLEQVERELCDLLAPDSIGIFRYHPKDDLVEILLAYENGARLPQLEGFKLPLEQAGITGWVIKNGRSLLIRHLEEEKGNIPVLPQQLTEVSILSWLGVPLVMGERVIGALSVQARRPYAFDNSHQRLLELMAAQIALAMENARLYEAEQTAREHAERLFQAGQALSATLDLKEVFKRILTELHNVVPYDSASVQELHNDRLVVIGGDGFPNLEELIGVSFEIDNPTYPNGIVIRERRPVILHDAQENYNGFRQPPHAEANIHSWLGVPMLYGDEVVGMITLDKQEPGFFTEEHAQLAMAFAAQAAIAIQNARLYTQTRRDAERRTILHRASQEIMQVGPDMDKICAILHRAAEQLVEFYTFTVSLVDWEREEIYAAYLFDGTGRHPPMRFPLGRGLTGYVVRQGTTLYIRDVETDLPQLGIPPVYFGDPSPIRCILIVPMRSGDRVIGTLSVQDRRPNAYTDEDRETLELLAATAAGAMQTVTLFQKVQEQAERIQRIVDTMPEGVLLLDADLNVVVANPRAQEYLQVLAPTWHSGSLAELGGRDVHVLLQDTRGGRPYEIRLSEGRIFEMTATPLGEEEPSSGWVLVIREVTREREIQQRVEQHERLAAIGRLAAGIAHDFNNIMQGIVGFANLLARREDLPEDARRRLRMIAQQGNRATHLVRQILDFSRASQAKREHLDLCSVIRDGIFWLQDILPSNIRIELDIPDTPCPAYIDPTQIQQVLTNLVTNARDAMPEGGIITVRLRREHIEPGEEPPLPEMHPGDWYVLSISDTGVGIPDDVFPHIFEPFFTTKDVDKGVGLGLAQVYGIVQLHDGHISVKSRVGDGTTFYIYLPAETRYSTQALPNLSKRTTSL